MPKYITFFKYSAAASRAMINTPSDRAAAAKSLVESIGGKLDAFYWMQGHFDGFLITNLPDSLSAAALSAAVGSTGAVDHLESHEIYDGAALAQIVKTAKTALAGYKPPTA